MKYITLEQLKEAGEDVVRNIMRWWVPEKGDLATSLIDKGVRCVARKDSKKIYFEAGYCTTWEWNDKVAPLLTVGQLIDFIQDRTGLLVCIDYDCDDIYFELKDLEQAMATIERFSHYDLLEGLWEVACSVATNVRYDK